MLSSTPKVAPRSRTNDHQYGSVQVTLLHRVVPMQVRTYYVETAAESEERH